MARMFPDRIPGMYGSDPARRAECEVYLALSDSLPEEYMVFGWVAWVSRRPGSGARDNEADFVIAHPERGMLVLEVKGGALGFDARTSAWSSTDSSGRVHALKQSPFLQARDLRYDLERKLEDSPGWPIGRVPFGYAVVFPDSAAPADALGPDAPAELLIGSCDMGRLDERLAAIAHYWRKAGAVTPGADGMEAAQALLAHSFQLRTPLGRTMREDARELLELSEVQYGLLDALSRNRRMLVTGGAGTGKTLLALEKAKRLARDEGFKTLLTCFNLPLAEYLQASAGAVPNLTVLNFHELCARFARRAGKRLPDPLGEGHDNEFYRTELPELLADALATVRERFEAIVLDEGQDFSATDRAALELTLDDRKHSVLYVFQDETQAIYRDGSPWPAAGMSTYELSENRRNTQAIHTVLERLAGDTRTRAVGPAGARPEFIVARTAGEQARELSRVLHRLIREESVPPGNIAVLTSSRSVVPELVKDGRIGAFEVTTGHAADDGRVLVESVTRFKGLERDVIVLVRIEPVLYCEFEPLLYVGTSRARLMLVVIGDEELVRRFAGAGELLDPRAGQASG